MGYIGVSYTYIYIYVYTYIYIWAYVGTFRAYMGVLQVLYKDVISILDEFFRGYKRML